MKTAARDFWQEAALPPCHVCGEEAAGWMSLPASTALRAWCSACCVQEIRKWSNRKPEPTRGTQFTLDF